jgi:peptidoglycan/LPS O-acetylase OafA/YrhL
MRPAVHEQGSHTSPMGFRNDIQALRGLAVLLVIFDHANVGLFRAGYLGVDIFFVISGYLITGMVKKAIEAGSFRFSDFYFRRAKRLLPAAYVTFLVTGVLSPFFLVASEQRDFLHQLIGAVTFTANFVLWRQADYFAGGAEFKPLLHVWSLSIEEQYYLLLPASLVFLPRAYWRWGAVAILIGSLLLSVLLTQSKPVAAFYLLPARAWELAIGSIAALGALDGAKARAAIRRLFWPALLGLMVLPSVPSGLPHPGVDAAIACAATLIVILRRHPFTTESAPAIALAKVGDSSYSLYLVHWPIFAFLNNAYVGESSVHASLVACALSLALGYVMCRVVELPIRRLNLVASARAAGTAIAASVALIAVPIVATAAFPAQRDFTEVRRGNYGFGQACDFEADFRPKKECRNSDAPTILVWGDSFAMHLVPGLAAVTDRGIVQATRHACGPFLDLTPVDPEHYPRPWAEQCLKFNQSVFEYLANDATIQLVVVSSVFTQYLYRDWERWTWGVLKMAGGELVESEPSVSLAVEGMRRTASKVRGLGKRIIVVAPPPSSGFDIGLCLDRKANGKVIFGASANCEVPVRDFRRRQARVLEFLDRVRDDVGVEVIRFDDVLCSAQTCVTKIGSTFLYRDSGHLSYEGSRLLAQRMSWGDLVARGAP